MVQQGSVSQSQVTKVLGERGLSIWGKQVQEEYLRELKPWSKASQIFREMQDDTIIGTLLDAIKTPLLAADFDVQPAGDSQGDEDAADFIWQAMNGMKRQTWRSHVNDMLEALEFGFAIGEIVLDRRDDGRLWLRNIEPRGQETLLEWDFDDEENAVTFVQTGLHGERLEIPLAKCVHVTFRGRKGNPMGKALLRSLYRPWRFLKNLENLEGIGIERDVGGAPVADIDKEMLVSDADMTALKDALGGLRMDEIVYLIPPPGVKITPYGGGSKMYDVAAVIQRKQKEILMRFFAQFLELGMENVGTQALVEGSQDFFSLALKSVQQELLEAWSQQLVPLLLMFNQFPGLTSPPQITWADPGKPDIKMLLDAYQTAVATKVLTPLREDEEKVRAMLDLPDLPEGVGEGPRVTEPTTPGPFGPEITSA